MPAPYGAGIFVSGDNRERAIARGPRGAALGPAAVDEQSKRASGRCKDVFNLAQIAEIRRLRGGGKGK